MKTSNSDFKHQEKFLEDKPLLSYCDVFDNHGLTPDELKNKDIFIIFSESKIYINGEIISDFICKLKSGLYLYLHNKDNSTTYKMRIYYENNNRNELDLLINNIKRQIKNGTTNIRTNTSENIK